MKKLFKSVMAIMVIAMLFGSCGKDEVFEDDGAVGDIDYTNYPESSAAFFVRNNTPQKLVAFKGSLDERYKIGGIPAGAQNHGLKNNTAIFTATEDFPMILLTEDQYLKNKTSLSQLEFTPFTKVYVFFNKSGDNTVRYEISDKLGGDYVLNITNPSTLNVELRVGGVAGPTLGYAPAGMQTTKLSVGPGDLDVFPVFKYFNKQRDIIETIYPKRTDGRAWFRAIVFDVGTAPQMLNIIEALQNIGERTSGVAYLVISNSSSGAIRLLQGTNMVYTTTGTSYWNASVTREFQIPMATVTGSKDTFSDSLTVSNYRVGPSGDEVAITSTEGSTNLVLKNDYMYTVNVSGDPNNSTLKAVVEMREGETGGPQKITFNDFALHE